MHVTFGFGTNQNRNNLEVFASLVEIFQIKAVLQHLLFGLFRIILLADLEFQHENGLAKQQNNINSPAQSWNGILKQNGPFLPFLPTSERFFENGDFFFPSNLLIDFAVEFQYLIETANDSLLGVLKKLPNRCNIVRFAHVCSLVRINLKVPFL